MAFALHQDGLVAPLKQVADQAVAPIHVLGVDAVQVPHSARQVALGGLEQQVEMIRHLAIRMHGEIESHASLAQHGHPGAPIVVILEDGRKPVAACSDVVERAGKFESQWSGHRSNVAAATR